MFLKKTKRESERVLMFTKYDVKKAVKCQTSLQVN